MYQAEVQNSVARTCPHCGQNPVPELTGDAAPNSAPAGEEQLVTLAHPPVKRVRGPRKSHLIWKILLAWLVFIGLIYLAGKLLWKEDTAQISGRERQESGEEQQVPNSEGDQELLRLALPDCRVALFNFLSTDRVAARLPLVRSHPAIAERLNDYYRTNDRLKVDPEGLELEKSTIFHLENGEAVILTLWKSSGGSLFDVAFRLDGGSWVIDWEHFVRYSDLSWSQFLAGSGEDDVAVFRLLARQRMLGEEDPEEGVGVVLCAPIRRYLQEVGYQAPMMGLSADDPAAKRLKAAFVMAERHDPPFGAGFLDINPREMIRVRVKVERISGDGGFRYRIVEMLGNHWYSTDETGVVFVEEPDLEEGDDEDVPEPEQ